jgi:predicted nuclease of predicted toxin-antitoxin system
MKFLLDENADHRLVGLIQALGHEVTAIAYDYPAGLLDEQVLAIATKEKRILITNDRTDFGELVFKKHHPHAGIILFCLKAEEANIQLKRERLDHVLTEYPEHLHSFVVVTPHRVRVRKSAQLLAA